MARVLPAGKLPNRLLDEMVSKLLQDPAVLVGPGVGEDVAVINNSGNELLVLKTDPITFAADRIGYYITQGGGAMMGLPDKWVLSPFAVEVVDTRKTYFVDFDDKVLEEMYGETGNPYYPKTIPTNSFRNQTEPWHIAAKYMAWSVTDEMPDHVVAEILRVVWENMDRFGEYHPMGKFLAPETMGIMGKNIQFYHPEALKLLKAKGSPLGVLK